MSKIIRIVNNNCQVKSVVGLRNVSIINGRIYVGDKTLEEYESENNLIINVHIHLTGACESIENCDDVTVEGEVGSISTMSGNVRCRDVRGNVKTMSGDVTCSKVNGYISTMSGDVDKRLDE